MSARTGAMRAAEALALPVAATRRPFGDWMWFIDDANGHPIAQIMPSSDEATARALADLINRPIIERGTHAGELETLINEIHALIPANPKLPLVWAIKERIEAARALLARTQPTERKQ